MEQRDFLKDQIEQLGKVLAQVLSNLLRLKSNGATTQALEMTQRQLQDKLDIDTEKLISLDKKELKDYLGHRKLTAEHLELLSNYLEATAPMDPDKAKARKRLQKAAELLDLADELSQTTSFDRINKKREIENALRQYKQV